MPRNSLRRSRARAIHRGKVPSPASLAGEGAGGGAASIIIVRGEAKPHGPGRGRAAALALAISGLLALAAHAQDPFADAVVSFTAGSGAGFGAEALPDIVLGPPAGGGEVQQSLDVVSLGNGGAIVLRFDLPVICDGAGPDFTVFENAFHAGSPTGPVFEELGIVAVSQDGEHFVEFPYDADTHDGLAGRNPVLSHPDNGIDPLDPSVSGGDVFDLAAVGLPWAAYVRITDPGDAIPDPGNRIPPGDKGGFDLDAMAALHACDPFAEPTPSPSFTITPLPSATPSATAGSGTATVSPSDPIATPTPPPEATPTATGTASPTARPGDVDGDGAVTASDLSLLVAELFDGDGDDARNAGGGTVASSPGADANGDGRVTGADLTGISGMRGSRREVPLRSGQWRR